VGVFYPKLNPEKKNGQVNKGRFDAKAFML